MEYKEIREYVADVYSLMSDLVYCVAKDEEDGNRRIVFDWDFDHFEATAERVLTTNPLEARNGFFLWSAETPTERLKVMLIELLGVCAPFTDDLIGDYYDKYYVKGEGWVSGKFVEGQEELVRDVITRIGTFMFTFVNDLHLLCCEHCIDGKIKKDLESFYQKAYTRHKDEPRTANWLFRYTQQEPNSVNTEIYYEEVKRRGRRRKGSELSADEVVVLMELVAGQGGAKFGLNIDNTVASKILARLWGGEEGTFENALTKKWRYKEEEKNKMEEFIVLEKEWLKSIGFVE